MMHLTVTQQRADIIADSVLMPINLQMHSQMCGGTLLVRHGAFCRAIMNQPNSMTLEVDASYGVC